MGLCMERFCLARCKIGESDEEGASLSIRIEQLMTLMMTNFCRHEKLVDS